jgi:hypothetical protein
MMSILKYFGLLCVGCLMIASVSASCGDSSAGSFCSKIETGSSMVITVGTITTEMGVRFITGSADAGTEIFNNVDVGEYAPGIPAHGSVSAFIKGTVREENQNVELNDFTAISGNISAFSKHMKYNSVFG